MTPSQVERIKEFRRIHECSIFEAKDAILRQDRIAALDTAFRAAGRLANVHDLRGAVLILIKVLRDAET
jgi:ribosomal protein L7/L12